MSAPGEEVPQSTAERQIVDLDGRLLLPGFVESHSHPAVAGLLATKLQVLGTRTVADVQQALREYAAAHPDEKVLFGSGFPSALNTAINSAGVKGPHRADLDAIVSDRPVMLLAVDAHSAWLNSKALEVAGITKDTPDPLPGVHYYQRDGDGEPTGWAVESGAFWPLVPIFGVGSEADYRAAFATMLPQLSAMGITTVFDAGIPGGDKLVGNALRALASLDAAGALPLRYQASVYLNFATTKGEDMVQRVEALSKTVDSPHIGLRTVKIGYDGTIEGETAAVFKPYASGGSGAVMLAEEPFGQFLAALRRASLDAHIHAIGDRALHSALNAVAAARAAVPDADSRVTVAHGMLAAASDIQRLDQLEVAVQTTPHWAHDLAGSKSLYSRLLDAKRGTNVMRLRDLFDATLVSFGADHPATGLPFEQTAPLYGIEIGHTRRAPGDSKSEPLPPVEQRLTLTELVTGYTLQGARQLRLDADIGMIEVGKAADLVVLERDLFKEPAHSIHTIRVDLTMLAGRVVYQRPSAEFGANFR